jgi:hypothetical protein
VPGYCISCKFLSAFAGRHSGGGHGTQYTYTHPNADDQQAFVRLEVSRLVGRLIDVGPDHAADLHPHVVKAIDSSVELITSVRCDLRC